MQNPEPIVCKPTPWFLLRALAMLVMFSVFSVLFYIDGTTGYRKKNLEFHLHDTFQKAGSEFTKMKAEGELTPESWKEFASKQTVALPSDLSLLPVGTEIPMPWPDALTDFERMKPGQPHILWQKYSGENRMAEKAPKKPFDAGKIREQIIVFYICLSLALLALFFLVRTMLRSLRADATALTTTTGKTIPYADMKTLDLRKWDTKGIAVIDYETTSGGGRIKLDGLTYGGFKKESGEPAEKLMQMIRANFSGEIIEYAPVETGGNAEQASENA
jgi:hypothetical protein